MNNSELSLVSNDEHFSCHGTASQCKSRPLAWLFILLLVGCAQVPRESMELSDTIGRDLEAIEKSHKNFVNIVYDKYEKDVNDFVDKEFIPFYIRESLANTPSGKDLLQSLRDAAQSDPTGQKQIDAHEKAELWLEVVNSRINRMRSRLLEPLRNQRTEILSGLDSAYGRVTKANAAVTGYLASLAKVRDLQNDLLSKLGVPNLSDRVGTAALEISSRLDAETKTATSHVDQAERLKQRLDDFIGRWRE